jgi:hypothetical protein
MSIFVYFIFSILCCFSFAEPWQCWNSIVCRGVLQARAAVAVVTFNKMWAQNQQMQQENVIRINELRVEMCGWRRIGGGGPGVLIRLFSLKTWLSFISRR